MGAKKGTCLSIAAASLLGLLGGCAHVDEARAGYHRERAESAAKHGRFAKAADQERKANAAERRAEHDPLP